jgi:NAD+ diphosphatase
MDRGQIVNTFAGAALDRVAERRTDQAWVVDRLADPASRAVVATEAGVLVDGAAPVLIPLDRLEGRGEAVLLGVDGEGALFAVDPGPDVAATLPGEGELRGLREVAAMAATADAGLLAQAVGLLNWHRRHRFCANCGAATAPAEAGHVRACPRCGVLHHPRTDPVVIALVHDGDRVLLGRQAAWPRGRYSALAGFVEPGESLEEAVAREVDEEAGVAVRDVRYRSSQPWPFPSSLMLGFEAAYAGGEARTRDGELEDVRWVSRAEAADAAARSGDGWAADERADDPPLILPPPLAIARRLVEGWLGRG